MTTRPRAAAVAGRGLVDPTLPLVAADDEGFARGRAAFETLRVYAGRPFRLEEHLARLEASAATLDPPEPDRPGLRDAIESALAESALEDAVLRLYWTPGADAEPLGIALVSEIPAWIEAARERGQRLVSLAYPRRSEPWLLPGTKSVSYATHIAAEAEAKRRGADDAVLVDLDGTVLEGPVTNIWWREGRTLVTPSARARDPRGRDAGGPARARAGTRATRSRPAPTRSSACARPTRCSRPPRCAR